MDMRTDDFSAFGQHMPRGWMAGVVRLARRCPATWSGKRVAFFLRALAIPALRGKPLDVETIGARMRLYPAHNVAEKNLLFTPQYFDPAERAFLAERLRGDFVFIDVGANVGGYALAVAAQAGSRASILAIEPQPDIFERLSFNIRQNAFPNIKAYACAIADHDGEITLFVDASNKGESSMRVVDVERGGAQIKVPAKALSTILSEERFEHVDAVKLDVEGAEDLILEPFFRDVPRHLWPKILIVEDAPARWAIDLPALIARQGYRTVLRTRTNVIYELR